MEGKKEWHVTRALEVLHAALIVAGALTLAIVLAGCAAVLTGEDGKQLLGVQVERSVSSLNSAPLPR